MRRCTSFETGKRPPGTLSLSQLPVSESDSESDLGSRPCHWRLQAGKRERPMVEEHGGYLCAGCKKSWLSLHSLTHHSTSPAMRGTACEKGDSSRQLRNVYRSNLATGLEFRLPIIPAGTKTLVCNMCCMMCITPHVLLYYYCPLLK